MAVFPVDDLCACVLTAVATVVDSDSRACRSVANDVARELRRARKVGE
jgi:hypothetical protein